MAGVELIKQRITFPCIHFMAHFLGFDYDQMNMLLFSETTIQERYVVTVTGSIVCNELGITDPGLLLGRSWHGCHPLNAPPTSQVRAMTQSGTKAAKPSVDQAFVDATSIGTHRRADLHLVFHNAYHSDAEWNTYSAV